MGFNRGNAQTQLWLDQGARRDLARLLTTQSEFFTIRSTGFVNESERTIEAALYFRTGGNTFSFMSLHSSINVTTLSVLSISADSTAAIKAAGKCAFNQAV